jgi:hypothetical protein
MSTTSKDPVSILYKLIKSNYEKLKDAREIFEIISNRMKVLDDPQELVTFLGQYLKPKELEKKQNGEVFTPPELIRQKFDRLSIIDPLIWSDPSKKFLDPANGIGNYPALAFHRLMEGLKSAIPNEADRKKHILENMLYMCELNKKNIEVSRKIFDPDSIYKLNLYQGSYLELDTDKEWSIKQFDVVFGNPPYNAPNKEGRATGNTLYPRFLAKIEKEIKPGGYQVLVHPGIWRKPGHKLHDIMFGRQILYMEIHTKKEGMKLFNATTRYEWYIMKNCIPYTTSTVRFDDGLTQEIMINKELPCLVNRGMDIWDKLYQASKRLGCLETFCGGSEQSSKCKQSETIETPYPFVNSTSKTNGVKIVWSKRAHPMQYEKKVIYANNEVVVPFYDSGKLGVTQHGLYCLVSSEREATTICRFLVSKLIRYIIAASKWSMFQTEYETFRYIPKPSELPDNFTDADVYTYFDITPDEIKRIETEQNKYGLTDYIQLEAPCLSSTRSSLSVPNIKPKTHGIVTNEVDYTKMKLDELKQLCKDRKIKGFSGKNKNTLIEMLSANNSSDMEQLTPNGGAGKDSDELIPLESPTVRPRRKKPTIVMA